MFACHVILHSIISIYSSQTPDYTNVRCLPLRFPISAVSGEGVKELLWHVQGLLDELPEGATEFEQEYELNFGEEEGGIFIGHPEEGLYTVEGPKVERMLGYTNLESERGFDFFQKFMKENGVIERLTEMGIEEGDTVRLYNLEFDYYR